jgi:nucleotide-binding universal stress UspA family protein
MLSTIVVPFDNSALAERAFPYAAALAQVGGARLVLLYARTSAAGAIRTVAELAEALDAELLLLRVRQPLVETTPGEELQYLELVADRVQRAERRAAVRVEIGSPPAAIPRVARAESCDLIVMATHGREGLARLTLGSVATGVLHRTDLPLLLIRPPATHQAIVTAWLPALLFKRA